MVLVAALLAASSAVAAPQHVVSTFLCTDEYVFRLLPRERITALSFLAGDTNPVVSTIVDKVEGIRLIRPSGEGIIALKPDLVVMLEGSNPRLHAIMDKAHIAVLDMPLANSLSDVRRVTAMLGEKLGAQAQARALLVQMDAVLKRAAATSAKPAIRTLIYEPNGYATSGGLSDEVMRAAGLLNIATQLGMTRLSTIPVEAVIAGAPDLLILNGAAHSAVTRADLIQHHPALHALDKRTVIANANLTPLLCPGPWSVEAPQRLCRWGSRPRPVRRRVRRLGRLRAGSLGPKSPRRDGAPDTPGKREWGSMPQLPPQL